MCHDRVISGGIDRQRSASKVSCALIKDNELELKANPHTETDLRKRCVPVGWKLGLL